MLNDNFRKHYELAWLSVMKDAPDTVLVLSSIKNKNNLLQYIQVWKRLLTFQQQID